NIFTIKKTVTLKSNLRLLERGFIPVKHDELFGPKFGKLNTQFRANGTARSSNQNLLASDKAGNLIDIGINSCASNEILNRNGAKICYRDRSFHQALDGRSSQYLQASIGASVG